MKKTYKNRSSDVILFEQISENEITMEGGKYLRFSYKVDYSAAYDTYIKESNDNISLKEFTNRLYKYDIDKHEYVYPELDKYKKLVESTDDIGMVDPSGGPYLSSDTDMSRFGLSGIIDKFEVDQDNKIRIILK